MINFLLVKGIALPDGLVKKMMDTHGNVLWEAEIEMAKCTVKHWLQNIGAGAEQTQANYTIGATDTFSVECNSSFTPYIRTFNGFTAPTTSQTVEIGSTGEYVVNYYYTRNRYVFTLGSHAGVNTSGSSPSGSYQYGETITLRAVGNTGYTLATYPWTSSTTAVSSQTANSTFAMPAENVTMTPTATLRTYYIRITGEGGLAAIRYNGTDYREKGTIKNIPYGTEVTLIVASTDLNNQVVGSIYFNNVEYANTGYSGFTSDGVRYLNVPYTVTSSIDVQFSYRQYGGLYGGIIYMP